MYSNFSQYGEALKELIKSVFVKGNVIMEPVDTAFDYAIKQSENKLKFPFISFYPDNTISLDRKNNAMPSYTEGIAFENPINIYNKDGSLKGTNERLAKNAELLYIIIGYQIDVWATTRKDAEELMQELIFWLHHNQEVKTKYNNVDLKFSFDLGTDIVDNSDLTSYNNNGKLYRYSYNIQIHATLLRSENYFTVVKPNINIEELNKEV
jgi:hypothetical protein